MSEKKRFVTLFPPCTNNELVKDVGMIAYIMAKYYDYESEVVGCNIDLKGDYVEEFQKVITLHTLKRYCKNDNINGLFYICRHAKEIDILHIFHFNPKKNSVWARIYKLLNPKGIVYLKLDMDLVIMEKLKKHKKCTFGAIKKIDLISAESKVIKKNMEELYGRDIKLIPNGYYDLVETEKAAIGSKENVIITVARLGTYQKATDVLLEAFCNSANQHTWNLRLVGSVEPSFQPYITMFFEKHPNMKNRIEFVGVIKDRQVLAQEYQKAKVIILPSRWEGFPLVLPEAMKNGCYLILSSQVPPAPELTDYGNCGLIVEPDNIEQLTDTIVRVCTEERDWNSVAQNIMDKAASNYSWIEICSKLDRELKDEQ